MERVSGTGGMEEVKRDGTSERHCSWKRRYITRARLKAE